MRLTLGVIALVLTACGGGTIEIVGTWTSNFGGTETITESAWAGAAIVAFDNGDNWAVTQNPADAQFDPGKFNKLVWTEPGETGFHYCFVDFGLESAEAAEASTKTADATDPDAGGCGGFSWTKLSP